MPAEDLQRAVRAVAAGRSWLDPAVTGRVLASYRNSPTSRPPDRALELLTAREREVVALIGSGMTNAEMAAQLVLGEDTVKTHISHIFSKPQLRGRAAAVVFAFDHGLVTPSAPPRASGSIA